MTNKNTSATTPDAAPAPAPRFEESYCCEWSQNSYYKERTVLVAFCESAYTGKHVVELRTAFAANLELTPDELRLLGKKLVEIADDAAARRAKFPHALRSFRRYVVQPAAPGKQ